MARITTFSGVINVDKPAGITSHDVVARVRKLLAANCQLLAIKVGHTGTLDPFATGVLLVAIGPATRLISFTHVWDKEYVAAFTLGATSDTDDITGKIKFRDSDFVPRIFGRGKTPSRYDVERVIHTLTGAITQVPPTYSAVKVKGKKLYEYARAGLPAEVLTRVGESKKRLVTIHDIQILHYDYPNLDLKIRCGTGTYIRTLARDLGTKLGIGAYVSSLRRTHIGEFDIKDSVSLNKLSTGITQFIHNPAKLISHLPRQTLTSQNIKLLRQGNRIPWVISRNTGPTDTIAIFDENKQVTGVATYNPNASLLAPKVIL